MSSQQMSDLIASTPGPMEEEEIFSEERRVKLDVRKKNSYSTWAWILLLFIIIAVIVWVILYVSAPGWVMKKDALGRSTGQVDPVAALVAAIIIALLITFILYIIYLFLAPQACTILVE